MTESLSEDQSASPSPAVQPSASPFKNLKKPFWSKRWLAGLTILFFFLLAGSLACAWHYQQAKSKGRKPAVKPARSPAPSVLPEPSDRSGPAGVIYSHNLFGFKLLKTIENENLNDNLIISPTSLNLTLAMILNGARGQTRQAIEEALGLSGFSLEKVNQANLELVQKLEQRSGVEVKIANSAWLKEGKFFHKEFLNTTEHYYHARVGRVDFEDKQTIKIINRWVSGKTNHKISGIVDWPLPKYSTLYLINAIYFKGGWTNQFNPAMTRAQEFTPPNQAVISQPMMIQTRDDFCYLETESFQAVKLAYGNSRQTAMYVFLPKADLSAFKQELSLKKWQNWLKRFVDQPGTLVLPKFKLEYKKKMAIDLKNLGMELAFDKDRADFSKIAPVNNPAENIYISQVTHKTFLEVNEEGAEASAATSVELPMSGGGQSTPSFYMEVNRPFFLAIYDEQSQAILFMGLVNNPAGSGEQRI